MNKLVNFLNESPTAFLAIENITKELEDNSYEELDEKKTFKLKKGGKYYVTRNGSSVIAFNIGKKLTNPSLQICASHSDCPGFKIKPNGFSYENGYLKLNTEVYGGTIYYPWLDRPLGLAGRVIVKEKGLIKTINYKENKPFCVIPSLAIHMNRDINKDLILNPAVDLLPLCSLKEHNFNEYLKKQLKKDILGFDLYLYPFASAFTWGIDDEFISSNHIDNLECGYATLLGFINNFNDENINMYCCFDNEEVGSLTRQGADSDFLECTLRRICDGLKLNYYELLAKGMLLSCDNAHAVHPNHVEKADPVNRPRMNEGIVIKYNANQSYTSDGLSSAILKDLLDKHKIPYQIFTNRSDMKGGPTLGNLSNGHCSLVSVDIGLAQLAMHSPVETTGIKDFEHMINCAKYFYKAHLKDNTLI